MQKLYYLRFGENSVILFYNNIFMIYLVILSDFGNLKLENLYLKFLFSHYGCSVKIWLHIQP